MTTSVVNVRRDEACDVYIGRPSTFGNPIVVGQACPECLKYHAVPGDTLVCFSRYFWRRVGAEPAFRAKLRGLIGERPRTAYELAQELWGNVAVTQAFLTLSEVVGHVDLLIEAGLVREVPDGDVVRFEATGAEGEVEIPPS